MIQEYSEGHDGFNVSTFIEIEDDNKENFFKEFKWWLEGILGGWADIYKIKIPGIPNFIDEGYFIVEMPYGVGNEYKEMEINAFCIQAVGSVASVCLMLQPIYEEMKKNGWEKTTNSIRDILDSCNLICSSMSVTESDSENIS